ncbi:MAG TPA: helicase HerA-like domain-containing protein [Bacteroidales bacterium]|nr:helicase HerA-like domain-containing protein [Bacteroidales bacterium]
MSKREDFFRHINEGYATKGDAIILGGAMLDGEPLADAFVKVPLKTLNRHGLIAGATGTGKTKTLQVISEQLSEKGIPVLVMDVKGDLSGVAMPGEVKPFITDRHARINLPYSVKGFPVELLTLSEQNGVRLRATVSEFGPVLFSRILDLNDTQAGIISVIFKYCDDAGMALIDLKDIKKVIQFVTEEGKEELEREYGAISTSSTGIILRKIIELEQQGADIFFGEMSFDIYDLMRRDKNGNGYINIIRLTDIQDKPKLFSTFMLSLLAEVYSQMPEKGDQPKPELVIFIDEAHLIFNQASKTLLDQIETIIKLIRSKGVGVFFVTQNPTDVPPSVLAQLGLKVQHALRAFTANDRKAIKLTAENFPLSDYYKTEDALTALGTGEAFVTVLNEKGIPTPLAATMLRAPMGRMDILTDQEIANINSASDLVNKYSRVVDRESAYEMLERKISNIEAEKADSERRKEREKEADRYYRTGPVRRRTTINPVVKVLTSATFIRGVMGVLTRAMKK